MAEGETTFMTTTGSAEDEKVRRLASLKSMQDPEEAAKSGAEVLLGSMMGDALANVVQEAAAQQEAAAKKKSGGIEEGSEEHWNLVMKKLAPAGYKKSPQWQKGIIDRVIKKMAGRQTKGEGNPLTQGPSSERATVDLAAIGLPADMAQSLAADEKRMHASLRSMSEASLTKKSGADISTIGMGTTKRRPLETPPTHPHVTPRHARTPLLPHPCC